MILPLNDSGKRLLFERCKSSSQDARRMAGRSKCNQPVKVKECYMLVVFAF